MNSVISGIIDERVKGIFAMLFKTELQSGTPYILEVPDRRNWGVTSVVGVTGDCYGIMAIRVEASFTSFLLERSRFQNTEGAGRAKMINDMIGEIINIISGNVLSVAAKSDFNLSIPVTIQGEQHSISWPKKSVISAIPFTDGVHRLEIQYSIQCEKLS